MGYWEKAGVSNEWYTPAYIFDALQITFDLDVAAPYCADKLHVPARNYFYQHGLEKEWFGLVWMNPPFGGRNGIVPWLDKFFNHGNGIALTPDRTSTDWWQNAARRADRTIFIWGKVKFERPDGSVGKSPSNGTTLFAVGPQASEALMRAANTLGAIMQNSTASDP